jgi:hypothetical protein
MFFSGGADGAPRSSVLKDEDGSMNHLPFPGMMESAMKKVLVLLVLFAVAIPVFAGKKKKEDWQTGKLVDVKTQDMQAGNYTNPNSLTGVDGRPQSAAPGDASRGPVGGSFSSAPTHFIIYHILLETPDEFIYASLSREVGYRPPDLKIGKDIQWKSSGPKFIDVKDSSGKKFQFKIDRQEKKQEPAKAS